MFVLDFYKNELKEKEAELLLIRVPYIDDQLKNLREFPEKAYDLFCEFKKFTNPETTTPDNIAIAYMGLKNLYKKMVFNNLYDSLDKLFNKFSNIENITFKEIYNDLDELDKLQQTYILKVQNFTMAYYRKTSFGAKEIYDFALCDYALVKKTRPYATEVQIINELIGLEKSGLLQLLDRYIQNNQFSDACTYATKNNLVMNLMALGIHSLSKYLLDLDGETDATKQKSYKILIDSTIHNLLYGIGHFRRLYKIP